MEDQVMRGDVEPRDLDDVEEDLSRLSVIEDTAVLDRAVYAFHGIAEKKRSLGLWYKEEIARLTDRGAYLKQIIGTYAVAFRERTGTAAVPVRRGTLKVTKQQEVDQSDEAAVEAWFDAARGEGDTGIPSKPPRPIELDWEGLRAWVKWAPDGSATDPRTGEIVPGLRRGRPQPWHVSIKDAETKAEVVEESEREIVTLDVVRVDGTVIGQVSLGPVEEQDVSIKDAEDE